MAGAVTEEIANREDLVERLFAAFNVQLKEIETRIADGADHEILEDTKTLSGLARTLETLIALDRKVAHDDPDTPDLEAVRAELAERLAGLEPARKRRPAGAARRSTGADAGQPSGKGRGGA